MPKSAISSAKCQRKTLSEARRESRPNLHFSVSMLPNRPSPNIESKYAIHPIAVLIMEVDTIFAPVMTVNHQYELAISERVEGMDDSETFVWMLPYGCI